MLERPLIDIGVSMEDCKVFLRRSFATQQPSQLFQCNSKALDNNLLKFDADINNKPITGITESIRCLAVIPIATVVLRTELMQMQPMRNESVWRFLARIQGKEDTVPSPRSARAV